MKHEKANCTASVKEPSYMHSHECDMHASNPIQASEEKLIAEFASRPPLTRKHHIEWLRSALREHRAVVLGEAARECAPKQKEAWSKDALWASEHIAAAIRALTDKENV